MHSSKMTLVVLFVGIAILARISLSQVGAQGVPSGLANSSVEGIIDRITPTAIVFMNGSTYRRAESLNIQMNELDATGEWTDLRSGEVVMLSLDAKGLINSVKLKGNYIVDHIERNLGTCRTLNAGFGNRHYEYIGENSINGKVLTDAIVMFWEDTAVFSNRDKYDIFDAWIGKRFDDYYYDNDGEGQDFPITFVVLGDGKELYRSMPMRKRTPPEHIRISVKDYSGISLVTEPGRDRNGQKHLQAETGHADPADWAQARFIKLPESIVSMITKSSVQPLQPQSETIRSLRSFAAARIPTHEASEWRLMDANTWMEYRSGGEVIRYTIVSSSIVEGIQGTVVSRNIDKQKYFIPKRHDKNNSIKFFDEAHGLWVSYAVITHENTIQADITTIPSLESTSGITAFTSEGLTSGQSSEWRPEGAKTWLEKYSNGKINRFTLIGPGQVKGVKGILVRREPDGLEVFIPGTESNSSELLWHAVKTNQWYVFAHRLSPKK